MFDRWLTYIILFFILILIVYLVTLSVMAVVDRKLGDISIQLPKIEITKDGKIVTPVVEGMSSDVAVDDSSAPPRTSGATVPSIDSTEDDMKQLDAMFKNRVGTGQILPDEYHTLRRDEIRKGDERGDDTKSASACQKTVKVVGCTKDADCNIVNGDGRNVCKADGSCYCLSGSGPFCQYGPTNYKDPKDMTEQEIEGFKYKYRNNFTLQDYKNWLMLYKDDPQHLRDHHRDNLKILLRGGTLTDRDIPSIRVKPPMDPADYFQKMYEGGKISVHFPEESATGAMLPANYNKFDEFLPPEKTQSQWITGQVDLYKTPLKDDARELNYYLRPPVTVGVERELVGQEYLNWVQRHHNLSDIRKIHERKDQAAGDTKSLATFTDTS